MMFPWAIIRVDSLSSHHQWCSVVDNFERNSKVSGLPVHLDRHVDVSIDIRSICDQGLELSILSGGSEYARIAYRHLAVIDSVFIA